MASEQRALLRRGVFRRLWAGEAMARLGYRTAQFLLPLLAVVELGSSGSQTGLVSAAQFVPVVALSLTAGVFADRLDPRRLVLVCTVVRGAALGMLGLSYAAFGLTLWMLLAVALVVGSATVFYDVGYQSAIPKLLRPQELAAGNSLLQAVNSATQMAGPALAGLFVSLAGLPFAVSVTTALFAGALVSFWSLRIPAGDPETAASPAGRPQRGVRAVLTGMRFTWGCRPIRDLCVQSGLFNLHEQAFLTAFMIYGVREAGLSAGTVGLLIGVASAGALVGSVAVGRWTARLHAGRTLTAGLVIASASLAAAALAAPAGPTAVVFSAAFLCNGVALGVYNVYAVSLRQVLPPRELLGAVTANYRLVSLGPAPLGALVGGVLADLAGPGEALVWAGLSVTLCSLLLLRSPLKRVRRVEEAEAVPAPGPAGDTHDPKTIGR
ncbi:MFS transporter [Streptomyces sp. DSM 42041]|uniref:MFS transporter n=1 Tax=Streptomyces hazeniae TaxID=3075538 RepID=A0ABU2NSZ4_9ACTN|nr:MFS transporter [Streptomyces sp. DSM 42041]MDT0379879.1 MFS transporter [Streptomyces sp. DSM 42041]